MFVGPLALFGSEFGSGTLGVYDDQTSSWWHVCASGFDMIDAEIACKQMGFGFIFNGKSDYL